MATCTCIVGNILSLFNYSDFQKKYDSIIDDIRKKIRKNATLKNDSHVIIKIFIKILNQRKEKDEFTKLSRN